MDNFLLTIMRYNGRIRGYLFCFDYLGNTRMTLYLHNINTGNVIKHIHIELDENLLHNLKRISKVIENYISNYESSDYLLTAVKEIINEN